MGNDRCCILCFKPLHIDDSRTGADEYYKKLIECCQKFLPDDHTDLLTQWTFVCGSSLPFCIVCYTSSEKLYRTNKQLESLYKNLENYINNFTAEISSARVCYATATQSKISNVLKSSATQNISKESTDVIHGTNKSQNSTNADPVIVKNEELDLSDFDNEDLDTYFQDFQSDSEELVTETRSSCFKTTEKCILSKSKSLNNQTTLGIRGNVTTASSSRKTNTRLKIKSDVNLNTIQLKELRVTLERLSFDSKGKVIIPSKAASTTKRTPTRGKRKAAIRAIDSLNNLKVDKDGEEEYLPRSGKRRNTNKNIDFIFKTEEALTDQSDSSVDHKSVPAKKPKNRKRRRKPAVSEEEYKCSICRSVFSTSKELEVHSQTSGHLNNKSVLCSQCPRAFYNVKDCKIHSRYHRFDAKSCNECDISFNTYSSYKAHQKKHRTGAIGLINQCSICKVKWASMSTLFNHMALEHSDAKTYKCDKCRKLFYSQETFTKHNSVHDRKENDVHVEESDDAVIEWTFENIEEINKRVKPSVPLEKMEVAFRCEVCDMYFDCKRDLESHIKESGHINEKKAQCAFCKKRYFRNRDVYDHKRFCDVRFGRAEPPEDDNERPPPTDKKRKFAHSFKCSSCESTFRWSKDLDDHSEETGHVNEKTFACLDCSKIYYRAVDLKDHKRKHRAHVGKKPSLTEPKKSSVTSRVVLFECSECHTTFKLEIDLQTHCEKTGHVARKTISCLDCPETFYRINDLRAHKNKEHPFTPTNCNVCGKFFTKPGSYSQHMRLHKIEKLETIRCSLCEDTWASTKHLHDHINLRHPSVVPLKCDKCERQYYTQEKFGQHIQQHLDCVSKNIPFEEPDAEREWTWQNVEKYNGDAPLTLESNQKRKKGFVCLVCGQWFELTKLLDDHSENFGHKNEKTVACEKCDRVFYRIRDVEAHYAHSCAKRNDK